MIIDGFRIPLLPKNNLKLMDGDNKILSINRTNDGKLTFVYDGIQTKGTIIVNLDNDVINYSVCSPDVPEQHIGIAILDDYYAIEYYHQEITKFYYERFIEGEVCFIGNHKAKIIRCDGYTIVIDHDGNYYKFFGDIPLLSKIVEEGIYDEYEYTPVIIYKIIDENIIEYINCFTNKQYHLVYS